MAVFDLAVALGECLRGLRQLRAAGQPQHRAGPGAPPTERADLLARLPPMLGLMATIIPLGPGLAALGKDQPALLASAITTAFDATVLIWPPAWWVWCWANCAAAGTKNCWRRWHETAP